ncbi:MAG: YfhO family protein [candidate division WS1 bacterium]|nr:YfhO family protein [candidate division WS1 bacterium]
MQIRRLIIALLVIALPAGYIHQTVLLGRPLARDDASAMVYPIFHALDRSLAQGSLYLWDSAQWCGLPAIAGGETTGLYPPTLLLAAILPWISALHASYWLHLAVAIAACYWVARNLGARRPSAMIAAVAYAFSGYQAAHLVHFDHITALAHLPLMLAVLQTALVRNTPRWWALLAVEIALAFVCSHPMLFTMAVTVALLWTVFGHDWRRSDGATRLLPLVLALVTAGLLVTPQLLPTMELAAAQGRLSSAGEAEYTASYPFRARDLPRVLLPNIHGTVHENTLGGGPEWHETQPFTGATPLLLGIAGAIVAFRRRGWGFCIATFALGALLMPAEGNPIHAALSHLPVWGGFRATGRWMVLPIFALSLLSALALDTLPPAPAFRRLLAARVIGIMTILTVVATTLLWLTFGTDEAGRLVAPGLGERVPVRVPADAVFNCVTSIEPLLLLAAAIISALVVTRLARGDRMPLWGMGVVLLSVIAPQWHLWQVTNRTVPRGFYASEPQVVSELGPWRITTLPPAVVAPGWSVPPGEHEAQILAARELLTPALGTIWGVQYAEGYKQGLVTPVTLELWESYFHYGAQAFTGIADVSASTTEAFGTPTERMKRVHAVAGVQQIVTPGTIDDPDLLLTHEGIVNVYTYAEPHPRAWLATRAYEVPDQDAQFSAIKLRDFDPYRDVLLDRALELPAGDFVPDEVEVVEDLGERLTLHATCPEPAVLVLADAWYPGWSVTVDGEPAELMRANFAFRAVALAAGQHEVVFSYRPATWVMAVPMFAVGMLVVLALLLWPKRTPPREGLTPPGGSTPPRR